MQILLYILIGVFLAALIALFSVWAERMIIPSQKGDKPRNVSTAKNKLSFYSLENLKNLSGLSHFEQMPTYNFLSNGKFFKNLLLKVIILLLLTVAVFMLLNLSKILPSASLSKSDTTKTFGEEGIKFQFFRVITLAPSSSANKITLRGSFESNILKENLKPFFYYSIDKSKIDYFLNPEVNRDLLLKNDSNCWIVYFANQSILTEKDGEFSVTLELPSDMYNKKIYFKAGAFRRVSNSTLHLVEEGEMWFIFVNPYMKISNKLSNDPEISETKMDLNSTFTSTLASPSTFNSINFLGNFSYSTATPLADFLTTWFEYSPDASILSSGGGRRTGLSSFPTKALGSRCSGQIYCALSPPLIERNRTYFYRAVIQKGTKITYGNMLWTSLKACDYIIKNDTDSTIMVIKSNADSLDISFQPASGTQLFVKDTIISATLPAQATATSITFRGGFSSIRRESLHITCKIEYSDNYKLLKDGEGSVIGQIVLPLAPDKKNLTVENYCTLTWPEIKKGVTYYYREVVSTVEGRYKGNIMKAVLLNELDSGRTSETVRKTNSFSR